MSKTFSTPCDHVIATEFDDQDGVLVDLNEKRYYQLNKTAMLVWRGLESGRTLDEMAEEMTGLYDVSAEHAAASIVRVVSDLQARGLVCS